MRILVLSGFTILFFGFTFVRMRISLSKLSHLNWEELLAKLQPVSVSGISVVALDYLQPTKGQMTIEPSELWDLVGGVDGLRKMNANAQILMLLANYAQRWNYEECVVVAERMRSDALVLRRAVRRLFLGIFLRNQYLHGPFRVQEAASAYYLMRQRLLALYETSHSGRYSVLANAI